MPSRRSFLSSGLGLGLGLGLGFLTGVKGKEEKISVLVHEGWLPGEFLTHEVEPRSFCLTMHGARYTDDGDGNLRHFGHVMGTLNYATGEIWFDPRAFLAGLRLKALSERRPALAVYRARP